MIGLIDVDGKRTFIDIFAGMGTARMGFEQAGWECVYSIEWDKHKRKIYEVLFGKEPEGRDVRSERGTALPQSDCWVFGFPCQDISIAGKQTGFNGERSSLFFEVMRLLHEIKEENRPEWLLAENVKNFLSVNNGWDFLAAQIAMDEAGYDCQWHLLNSEDFGVPQHRERVFIVGHLRRCNRREIFSVRQNDSAFDKREKSAETPVVRTLTAGGHSGGLHSGMTVIIESEQQKKNDTYSIDLKGIYPNSTRGGVIKKERVPCMEGGGRQPMIVTRIRRLTPREYMRLQGVSDEITDKLIETGISDTQMYRAAGDAMTVNVVYEIAKAISDSTVRAGARI